MAQVASRKVAACKILMLRSSNWLVPCLSPFSCLTLLIPFSLQLPGPGLMVAIYFRDRRDGLDVLNGAMVDLWLVNMTYPAW